MANIDMAKFAREGARVRLQELRSEIQDILAAFPALRGGSQQIVRGEAAAAPQPHRRRRRMSAEARKRISDAQKKRWAAQKAGKRG